MSARTPPSADAACRALAAALPGVLGGLDRRSTTPRSPRTAAWGDPAVVLRCGVAAPDPGSAVDAFVVDGVTWVGRPQADGSVVVTVLDRAVFVEVGVPVGVPVDGVLVGLAGPISVLPPAPVA